MLIFPFNLALLSVLVDAVRGYHIHESCTGTDRLMMQASIGEAFNMASQAVNALNRRDERIDRLISLLFVQPGHEIDDEITMPLMETFSGILEARNEHNNPWFLETEIVFFCDDLKRMKKRPMKDKKPGQNQVWDDTVIGYHVKDFEAQSKITECQGGSDKTLAITTAFEVDEKTTGRQFPSSVSICSWFRSWYKDKPFKSWLDVSRQLITKLGVKVFEKIHGWPFQEIDGYQLLDKVVLHEMCHTRVGAQGRERDNPGKRGVLLEDAVKDFDNTLYKRAYGWEASRRLAERGPVTHRDAEYQLRHERATNNPDNLALFGSGIRLLNLDPSKFITDDGSISTTSPQRRGLEWPTSQANHAFDRFVTLVKEVKMEPTPFGNVD